MKPYEQRKKKPVRLFQKTKVIRIDWRTQIEVPVSIPDDVAIERYYQRHLTAVRPPDIVRGEIPQNELAAAVVDDSNLPEIE